MTMPSTSEDATSSLMRLASFSQSSSFMSCDPLLAICWPRRVANVLACGTAASGALLRRPPRREQLIDPDLTRCIRGLHVAAGGARNRAAGGEDGDSW